MRTLQAVGQAGQQLPGQCLWEISHDYLNPVCPANEGTTVPR